VTRIDDLHTDWLSEPAYTKKYAALEPAFAVVAGLICAVDITGLTQEQLASCRGRGRGRGRGREQADPI
jgi:hypothetical protein